MEKVLTVVVPTYNMEDYLDRCLTSLIMDDEHMSMLEVLVINDGSKDRSSEIAHSYEARYPDTFKVIDKENGNYGSCINRGVADSCGKYIKVLDADDWFDNNNLPPFISFLSQKDVDMIVSKTKDNHSNGNTVELKFESLAEKRVNKLIDMSGYDAKLLFMHSVTYLSKLIKSTHYHQLEGISYTDLQWATEPLFHVESIAFFNMVIYNYYIGRPNQTMDVKNRCKNMWMEEKVVLYLAGLFEAQKSSIDKEKYTFMKYRINCLIANVYEYYLIKYHSSLPNANLKAFDGALESKSPSLYERVALESIYTRLFSFLFIKHWRKHFSRKEVGYAIYDLYCKIKYYYKTIKYA